MNFLSPDRYSSADVVPESAIAPTHELGSSNTTSVNNATSTTTNDNTDNNGNNQNKRKNRNTNAAAGQRDVEMQSTPAPAPPPGIPMPDPILQALIDRTSFQFRSLSFNTISLGSE